MSPEDMQRFEVHTLASASRGEHLGISHNDCPEGWAAELDETTALAELVQRAEEHTEVCR